MSSRRLNRHITFLLSNLDYVFDTGRKSVLEALHLVVDRFPRSVLEKYADAIFLQLVARLIGDEDSSCREMVATLIRALISRSKRVDVFSTMATDWIKNEGGDNPAVGSQGNSSHARLQN